MARELKGTMEDFQGSKCEFCHNPIWYDDNTDLWYSDSTYCPYSSDHKHWESGVK